MCAQVHKDIASRALREAAGRKAKKVHFYQNGRPYATKLTVSIASKDFQCFEQLCQYLTEKSHLLNGVQFIFTLNGKRVATLDELEHGQSYVISGSKAFMPYPYGLLKVAAPRISRISNRYRLVREEDLRLIRPLSSKYNNVYANANQATCFLQNSLDTRVVTIVNNQNHNISSRVILNLKSPKSYDNLLRDLGQAVRMHVPKRMFTSSGLEVKSVSHLKHDLFNVDLFYVDTEFHNEHFQLITKFPSLESIEKFFESSVQRLNQISSSHSSNLDLRPHNMAFDSSLSNFDTDKQWRRSNEVSTHPIVKGPKKKSTIQAYKSVGPPTANKPKSVQAKRTEENPKVESRSSVSRPEKDVVVRRRSISKSRESVRPQEEVNIFSLDKISDSKYEQIQAYAERMLQETSIQIKNERLVEKYSRTRKPQRTSQISSPQSNAQEVSSKSVPLPTKPRARNLSENEPPNISKRIIEKKGTPPTKSTLTKTPEKREEVLDALPVIEAPITAKNVLSQNAENNGTSSINSALNISGKENTANIKVPSKAKLNGTVKKDPQSQNLALSTKSTAHRPQRPTELATPRLTASKRNGTLQKDRSVSQETNTATNPKSTSVDAKMPEGSIKKAALNRAEKFLHKGVNAPNRYLELNRVFGYNGRKMKNLFCLSTEELLFNSGAFAVLWNTSNNLQRFYTDHDNDIYCMRVDSKSQFVASSQMLSASKVSVIRVWSVKSLSTVAILKDRSLNLKITDMEFTMNNSLFVVSNETKLGISVWNWNAGQVIANASKQLDTDELVFGGTVHPQENDIMVTFGKMHLIVWHLHKDKTIDYRTALQTHSKISKTIHCADFLGDNSLLTGDAEGHLTIWAPFEVNNVLEFAIKEVKGHDAQLTCLKLTLDNILVSADQQGAIKTWDVSDGEFRLLNAIKLSSLSGCVRSIALPTKNNDTLEIFVGTSENFILKGSALQSISYDIVFEGHIMAIRTISFDPNEDLFYTASLDQKVCKWSSESLIWRTSIDVQAISSAVHPSGRILAIGSVNGLVSILACDSGAVVHHLEITTVCIGCLSYSGDGTFLVAGCQDGNLHVLPASDDGFSYSKVSILKGPLPILTLQWSMDTQFILTSVDDNNFQELILWDLHNTRYIRNVTNFSDNLRWNNPTCSGLEDARGTWDNVNLKNVINICNHYSPQLKYIVTGDENGYIRLFSYPCLQSNAAFFEYNQGGGSVTDIKISPNETFVVSCNFEGSILLWNLKDYQGPIIKI